MENENTQTIEALDLRTRKFIHAGVGFLGLNLVYLAIAMSFIPPFNLGLSAILSLVAFVLFLGLLTYYLLKGKKMLAQVLAVIFGLRSLFSAYSFCLLFTCLDGQGGIGPNTQGGYYLSG